MKTNEKAKFDSKTLAVCAMLTALSIIIGIFCKNFLNFGNGLFRITFENFPIILSGFLFGPLTGALVGCAADVLSYILSTQTFAISPIVTLGAALVGATAGYVNKKLAGAKFRPRLILSAALAHLVGSVIVKSLGLFAYYGWAVLVRIPLYLIICILEVMLMQFMFQNKSLCKILGIKR